MQYYITLNDPGESSVTAETVRVEADQPPDINSDPELVIFTRGGVRVALFRREQVQAVYEAPARSAA